MTTLRYGSRRHQVLRAGNLSPARSGARYSDLKWLRGDTALFAEARLTPSANQVLDTGEADLAYHWQAEVFAAGNGKLLVHQDGPQLAFATLVGDEKPLFISQTTETTGQRAC